MKASVEVRSHLEGDAVKLALDHPGLKTASVITGLLLGLPSSARVRVLRLVQESVLLADDVETSAGNGDLGRLHDGANDTGE